MAANLRMAATMWIPPGRSSARQPTVPKQTILQAHVGICHYQLVFCRLRNICGVQSCAWTVQVGFEATSASAACCEDFSSVLA